MHILRRFPVAIVALGLLLLTIQGAYALTGSIGMTIVLSMLCFLQWAFAKRAIAVVRAHATVRTAAVAAGWLCAWLAVAVLTVPLVGAELFQIFAADNQARQRFMQEQYRVQRRAQKLRDGFGSVAASLREFRTHARQMAELEAVTGGSCAVSRGRGAGEIHIFRQSDALSAERVAAQLVPELDSIAKGFDAVEKLEFDPRNVPSLRRELNSRIERLNSARDLQVLTNIQRYAEEAGTAGAAIGLKSGSRYSCDDPTRRMLLEQLGEAVTGIRKLAPEGEAVLLDPANRRDIAMASILRTLRPFVEAIPTALRGSRAPIDPQLLARYGVRDDVVLAEPMLPLVIAWMLEAVMLGVLFVDSQVDRSRFAPRRPPILRPLLDDVMAAVQAGRMQPLIERVRVALDPSNAVAPDYVDTGLFHAGDMRTRAARLIRHYRPWGERDLVILPLDDFPGLKAARELQRLGYLRQVASGLATTELFKEPELRAMNVAVSQSTPSDDRLHHVYEVIDESLARWLLSEPVGTAV